MGVIQYALCNHIKGTTAYRSTKYLWDVLHSEPSRLIYVSGNPTHQNLGDNTLFDAYKKLFYKYSFVHYPGGRALAIPSKLLKISGNAILAGGTLINRWGLNASLECIKLFPQFYIFGTGVAHPSFWSGVSGWRDTLKQWGPILRRSEYIGVRGPLSAELLTDYGIDNVEIVGDPVLVLAKDVNADNIKYVLNSIGLNLGQSLGNVWGSEEAICDEFIKLSILAKKNGWQVKWFVVWPKDLIATQKAATLSGTTEYIYQIYKDSDKYFKLVKSLSTFVGMKLHAVIMATCAYVPSIMLEYRPKCRDYMMSIGQESNTIRTDKFKAEEVWEITKDWNYKRKLISKALYQSMKPLRVKQQAKAEELMKVFKT